MNRTALLLLSTAVVAGCTNSPARTSSSVTATGPAGAQVATVGMTDQRVFTPDVVKAVVGTLTLTAKNQGSTPHNLLFDTPGLGGTGTVAGQQSGTVTLVLRHAGTYTFTCTFHPGMAGRLVVS